MERRTFLGIGCSCGALSLLGSATASAAGNNKENPGEKKKDTPQEMHQDQVINILKYVDLSQREPVKEDIFSRLGYECFHSRKLGNWIGKYTDNVQAFLDRVNVEHKSKYWESLEFNADKTVLRLTGRKVEGCACAFSDCSQPPKSLCHYCCKNFQQELFGMLLGRKVKVRIEKSFLLGDERCDTSIHVV